MTKGRLEALSDGVLAIILTIMVLSFQTPKSADLDALRPLVGPFLGYVLSFLYVGIYWSNHHHLLAATNRISGAVLLANSHLLFWLSLVPFATSWMTTTHYAFWPVVVYGVLLLCAALAYFILTICLLKTHEDDSTLALAIGRDIKGKLSLVIYAISIALAFWHPLAACVGYFLVACVWLIPDRRLETRLQ